MASDVAAVERGSARVGFTDRLLAPLFCTASVLGAALLFMLEPAFTKMALPRLGGSPAVWSTAVLFFQMMLLAGYGYVHAMRRLPLGIQLGAQIAIALIALATLPFHVSDVSPDAFARAPIAVLLLTLFTSVGLPFFVLSTTSPLLQSWFARSGHRSAADPYFLYVASNLGSMLALLAYPFLIEPVFGLHLQTEAWRGAYVVFVIAVTACGATIVRDGRPAAAATVAADGSIDMPTLQTRLKWIALAFVPSSLMLGVTSFLTTMIAPIPLLWIAPLAIYLLTFMNAFSTRPPLSLARIVRLVPYGVLPLVMLLSISSDGIPIPTIAINLAGFTLIALACHGRLGASRPAPAHLTAFYLYISIGGALGGIMNAVVAPALFSNLQEFPLAIVLGCALLPSTLVAASRRTRILDFALPAGLFAFLIAAVSFAMRSGMSLDLAFRIGFGIATVTCFGFYKRRVRFALGIGAALLASAVMPNSSGEVTFRARNFFGVKNVVVDPTGRYHLFTHGAVIHGIQAIDPARATEPLGYYSREGPAGAVVAELRKHGSLHAVGSIGLGIGSLACYRRPGESWTFYEIDPIVIKLAQTPKYFSYLSHCAPREPVIEGDARLTIARYHGRPFDLLFVDAYSADQPPVHLLTREALALYLSKVSDRGVLAFNISNTYFDFRPVLAKLAADGGLVGYVRDDVVSPRRDRRGERSSTWAVIARRESDLGALPHSGGWNRLATRANVPLWTDDYSSFLPILSF